MCPPPDVTSDQLDPNGPPASSSPEPVEVEETTPAGAAMFSPATPPPSLSPQPGPQSESPDANKSPGPAAGSGSPRPSISARTRRKQLLDAARGAVTTAGGLVHQVLTKPGSVERDAGLFLPDDDDVEAIADPVAGLASRRMPEGADNPDVTDLIRLALGLVGYVLKQRVKRAQLAETFDGLLPHEAEPEPDEATS